MKLKIKETGEVQELLLIDPKTGLDYVKGFMDAQGAFDGAEFVGDTQSDAYICAQATYDWWEEVVASQQALEDRVYALTAEHGIAAVEDALATARDQCGRLGDLAKLAHRSLDNAFDSVALQGAAA